MASDSGGLGGLDMNALLGKAREMQDRMRAAGEAASRIVCDGDAGGGMVTVKANGHGVLVSVTVDPIAFSAADREMLEDLLLAAANQAITRARDAAEEEIKKITGGMLLPIDLTKFA